MAKSDEVVVTHGGEAAVATATSGVAADTAAVRERPATDAANGAKNIGGKTEYVVRAKDVVKIFKMGTEEVHALRGISLDIRRGEYVSIIGPSGSGKSTFFNMIGGLDKPNSGTVFINDVDMAQLDAMELAFLRCHTIGYIFQTFNLIPVMTALENVMLPTVFAGIPTEEGTLRAKDLCETVGLGHRLHNKPSQLSGGQQQRVAIARSLANNPSIVLADEPTGNLDERTGLEIIGLLRRLNQEKGVTVITATHDDKMVRVSDRAVHIRDGRLDNIEERDAIVARLGTFEEPVSGSH